MIKEKKYPINHFVLYTIGLNRFKSASKVTSCFFSSIYLPVGAININSSHLIQNCSLTL